MLQSMLDNPFLMITVLCMCWPGVLPMVGAFVLARNYNIKISRRNPGQREEI